MPSAVDITEDQSYAPPADLVTNGGFESDLSGWTTTGSAGTAGAFHTGSASAYSYLTEATFSQAIATVPGATYQISFWADNPYDTGLETESFTATWGGAAVFSLGNIPPSGSYYNFTQYTVDVVATSTTTTLAFDMLDTQGYWELDDVSVQAVGVTPGIEARTGAINFTDVDTADTHTVSYTPDAGGYLGTFTPTISHDTTGTGTGGVVTWTFTVPDTDIAYLNYGQSLTQVYHVAVNDGHGGITSQDVTVTMHGALPDTANTYNVGTTPGNSTGAAYDLNGASLVYTKSNDPDITNASTSPSISIDAQATSGQTDYYKFVITQNGTTGQSDIDHSDIDTWIRIRNSTNTSTVAQNDDSANGSDPGDLGSTSCS